MNTGSRVHRSEMGGLQQECNCENRLMTDDEDRQRAPEAFLIPVASLGVPEQWEVGQVLFHPGAVGIDLVNARPPAQSKGDFIEERVRRVLNSATSGSIAEVRGCADIDEALDAVRAAMDALRLFQLSRARSLTTSFGLPGDVYQSLVEYVATWERSAPGFRRRGDSEGWTFDAASLADWRMSSAFMFLSDALRDQTVSDGARRAAIGAQLFARAANEHRRDLKMLGLTAALEAWLIRREPGAQTYRLARNVSWFGCGQHDGNLCGRVRPICPYLKLSPDVSADRRRLATLRELGNLHAEWRCSEWHRVMDWYDARSGAAHGDPAAVAAREAESAEFWIAHYLAEPILNWLRTHQDDPVGDLALEVTLVSEPARWGDMLDALDSRPPPSTPPLD
jgi:hypothetical protein